MNSIKLSPELLRRTEVKARATAVVREMFPDHLKAYGPKPEVSRARQDGAGLYACMKYAQWLYAAGEPREKADLMLEALRDEIEALWGDETRSPVELCANEQAVNSREDEASLKYVVQPTDDNARKLLVIDQMHRAVKRARAASLLRYHKI